jgi:hypothetical protein
MIAESVHINQNIHHTAESMYQIFSRLVYSPNLASTTARIVSRCPVCILGTPKLVRRIMGSHRFYTSALPNEIIFLDSKGFSKCPILVDQATAKVTAYPSKDLLATTVQKQLYTYMKTEGGPRVVCTDLGTEFKKAWMNSMLR